MDSGCYRYEKLVFNDGLLNKTVDATYIVHLEDNGRLDDIMNQLKEYHPTNIVYIAFNKGYKKCAKADFIVNPPYDLVDANLNIVKHAKTNNYDNILILEDDFIFNPEIKDTFHINNINNFLQNKKDESFQYLLGCLPGIMIPYDKYNYIVKSCGMHAVIFSKKNCDDLLNIEQQNISDWDVYNNMVYINRYAYYKPLCYQLVEETENSKYWGANEFFSLPSVFMANILKIIFKMLQLDKSPEPGFSFLYFLSKIVFLILVVLLLLILYKTIYLINGNLSIKSIINYIKKKINLE